MGTQIRVREIDKNWGREKKKSVCAGALERVGTWISEKKIVKDWEIEHMQPNTSTLQLEDMLNSFCSLS